MDEDDESAWGEADVRTGVTESGTKELETVQQAMKCSSLPSFMLKLTSLLAHAFKENKKAQ